MQLNLVAYLFGRTRQELRTKKCKPGNKGYRKKQYSPGIFFVDIC